MFSIFEITVLMTMNFYFGREGGLGYWALGRTDGSAMGARYGSVTGSGE